MIVSNEDFNPEKSICACHIISNGQVLLLLRNRQKPQGLTWGVPAGKLEPEELPEDAILREVFEETGLHLEKSDLEFKKIFNVVYKEYPFAFHLFHTTLKDKPATITLNPIEHEDFKWCTPQEALSMNLIEDEDTVLKYAFNI